MIQGNLRITQINHIYICKALVPQVNTKDNNHAKYVKIIFGFVTLLT